MNHIWQAHATSTIGLKVYPYLQAFDHTFNKSANELFTNFFRGNSHIRQWMVFSDYAFYDRQKKADVVTYSFMPFTRYFEETASVIEKASFKDIKNLSRVNDEFIDLIKNSPIFNVAVILERTRRLSFNDEPRDLLFTFKRLAKMVESWHLTTPEGSKYYDGYLRDIALVVDELKGKRANLKIIRDIYIVSSLAAYLMFEVAKVVDVDKIGWFSDRDSLLSYKGTKFQSPIIFNLTHTLYHALCEDQTIDSKNNPSFGVPEEVGKVWYDSFLRIPDLICATLADYDPEEDKFSHGKYAPVFSNLLASNEHNIFFKLNFRQENENQLFEAVRLTLTRAECS